MDLSSVQACLPCNPACLTCSGTGPTDCLSCPPHGHLVLTSCLHQNQVQRKSPLSRGKQGDTAQPEGRMPSTGAARGSGGEPPGFSDVPPSQLPTVVAVLSCAFILAAFIGLFLLLQMHSSGTSFGRRTKLPFVDSGTRVDFGFGFGRGQERKARISYKGIPTVWGNEEVTTYQSESDSEEVYGGNERTAFIRTQSSV